MPPANNAQNAAAIAAMQQQIADMQAEMENDTSESGSSSSEATDSDDVDQHAKMQAPQVKISMKGSMPECYKEWKSVKPIYVQWHAVREALTTDETLGALFMECTEEPVRAGIYTALKGKRITFKRVMKYLSKTYEEDGMVSRKEATDQLRAVKRTGGQTLVDFLLKYDAVMLDALAVGYVKATTEGLDLIGKCDLTEDQEAYVMLELARKKTEKFSTIRRLLEAIGR